MYRLSSLFLNAGFFLFLLSCTATPQGSLQNSFYIYRFQPPAFIEYSEDFQAVGEIPFSVPPNCGLFHVSSPPIGKWLAIELSCPNGQTVLFLDTSTAAVTQPISDSDSHFLAWSSDGKAAYLKIDSLGNPRVARVSADGKRDLIPITEFTYDLASSTSPGEFTFTFSRGLGQGSELHLAQRDGRTTRLLYADQYHYISFARFSPDGTQIAFIKIPDMQTPFTVGELWVMDRDGTNARRLADADAGHGYAANWSPDGQQIAFVARENPEDVRADQSNELLISNIYLVEVESGKVTRVTNLEKGRVETPLWSSTGNTLAFNVVIDDRMDVRIANVGRTRLGASNDPYGDPTMEIRPLIMESTCCPAWMRK